MLTEQLRGMLKACADEHFSSFDRQGHADPGSNGPYGYPESPVRNTGHWLIIYSYLWKTTRDERYKQLSEKFIQYLLSEQKKSASGAITCILEGAADHTDGLIGQAWVIEALVYAYHTYRDERCLDCGFSIFKSQRFDENTGLWKRVEPDGEKLDYDYTLNHQVWFCASGLLLLSCREDEAVKKQVDRHLDLLSREYFGAHKSGLIRHYGAMRMTRRELAPLYIKQYIKYAGLKLGVFSSRKYDILIQEQGYHMFELYGFALLASLRKDLPFTKTPAFLRALNYGLDTDRLNEVLGISDPEHMNKYAYPYNSPAFEYPLIAHTFTGAADEKTALRLLDIQKSLTWDESAKAMNLHTADSTTLTARLYEYVRFLDAVQGT